MASPDLFAHARSALNPFLYADIGIQDGSGTLTIVSLFGQRGEDPWEAASRLARLPARAAVAALATMIAEMPAHSCSLPEATVIAERLVALLPGPAESRVVAAARQPLSSSPLRWPLLAWPIAGLPSGWLAIAAAGLAILVVCVWVWQALGEALG